MVVLREIGRVCFRGLNNNYGIRLNEPRRRKGHEGRRRRRCSFSFASDVSSRFDRSDAIGLDMMSKIITNN